MRCYVFGGSGFIGSYIVEELLKNNHTVINHDLKPSMIEHKVYDGRYIYMKGDIRLSSDNINELFNHKPPDIIFILSAIADIEECENNPIRAMSVNIIGLTNLLQCISNIRNREEYQIEKNKFGKSKIPKVVFASSVYAVSADHPYGISKMAGERLLKWYAKKYDFPYLIFRYGTIYGPRAGEDNSIKKLIKKSLDSSIIEHYGSGEERREYVHVRDAAVSTVFISGNNANYKSIYLITGADSIKAKRLCEMLQEIIGSKVIKYKNTYPDGHYTITPYRLQEDRAIKYIPNRTVDFGDGLLEVIEEIRNDQ